MMRSYSVALLAALAFGGPVFGQCVQSLSSPTFADTTGLTTVGNASFVADALRLTPNVSGQAGAAWYTSKVSVREGFTAEFTFRLGGTSDGLALVIQNQSTTALGGGGSGIGYGSNGGAGITSSIAVEIDTFNFPDEFASDHVSVQTNGVDENQVDDTFSLGHAVLGFDVNDGEVHRVRVEYEGQRLRVFVDDMDQAVVDAAVNLDSINDDSILDANGCAWIGFTAATGGATAEQDVVSFSFVDEVVCGNVDINFDNSQFQFNGEIGGRMEQQVAVTGSGPRMYQWQINDVDLVDDGRIQGAQTPHLVIEPLTPAEAGHIRLNAQNDCSGLGISWDFRLCGSSDYNGDGDFGTDQDIEAFFACLGGNCCELCQGSDFNFDGDFGTDQDIEAFFRVLGGGSC
jgi:hypothetical protein